MEIKCGQIFKHYKGNFYLVIGIGQDTETQEKLVIYRQTKKYANDEISEEIWVRPKRIFESMITLNNESMPRFQLICTIE